MSSAPPALTFMLSSLLSRSLAKSRNLPNSRPKRVSWRLRGSLPGRKIGLPHRLGGLPRLPAVTPRQAPISIRRLRRAELPTDTVALARFLIGKIVVRELPGARLSARIVETEAYPPRDPAAHHFRGPTPRNRAMFLRRAHAYVYFRCGNHFMLNVSAEVAAVSGDALIRALEPLE